MSLSLCRASTPAIPGKVLQPHGQPWRPLGSSPMSGGTACSCQALPCGSASGPAPTPRRSQSQALFFVFQAQSHIPSQQPALPSHPLIHGDWEGLPRAECSALGAGWRDDIFISSYVPITATSGPPSTALSQRSNLLLMGASPGFLSPPRSNHLSTQQPEKAFQNMNQILPFPTYSPSRAPPGSEDNSTLLVMPSQGVALPGSSHHSSHKARAPSHYDGHPGLLGPYTWQPGPASGALDLALRAGWNVLPSPFNRQLQSPLLRASHPPVPSPS